MLSRLIGNWVYGGALAGLLFLMLTPILAHNWPTALLLVYLCLPTYMIHQYEEHDNDRFRLFVNEEIFKGKEALTPWDVFVINIPGVWCVIVISLALSMALNIGFGLIAVYGLLINGVGHIGGAIAKRKYSPGLVTAIFVFLPLGGFALFAIQQAGGGTLSMHLLGAGSSIAIHAAILVLAAFNMKRASA
jgi:hypothetical protein